MKDARGHGSNGRGGPSHQFGVLRIPRVKVQTLNTRLAGQPWQTVKAVRNRVVAERIAQGMRVDNADTLMRVR